MKKELNLALVGASGAVGAAFLELLDSRNFPIKNLKLLASARSANNKITFKGEELVIEELTKNSFTDIDLAFFAAGGEISLLFAPEAVSSGALVIDNSSAYRLKDNVPLVVPSCNMASAKKNNGIIANPNCSTIQMVEALKPIHDFSEITRVIVATYQAVSGSGVAAVKELEQQIEDYKLGKELQAKVYPVPILMNAIPHVDIFTENSYSKEEMKMVLETQKIMAAPKLKIAATCVRVPVLRSHSEAIFIETKKKVLPEQAIKLWRGAGVEVINELANGGYPTPREMAKTYKTYVGRIREDLSCDNGLCFWCVADQLYKGAALNAIEIAENYFD